MPVSEAGCVALFICLRSELTGSNHRVGVQPSTP